MTNNTRRFLRLKQVIELVGYQRSAIYQKAKAGDFPRPHNLGARAVAWDSLEIEAWMDSRVSRGNHHAE